MLWIVTYRRDGVLVLNQAGVDVDHRLEAGSGDDAAALLLHCCCCCVCRARVGSFEMVVSVIIEQTIDIADNNKNQHKEYRADEIRNQSCVGSSESIDKSLSKLIETIEGSDTLTRSSAASMHYRIKCWCRFRCNNSTEQQGFGGDGSAAAGERIQQCGMRLAAQLRASLPPSPASFPSSSPPSPTPIDATVEGWRDR